MPLLYAEGREKAFARLREEIGKSSNRELPFPSLLAMLTMLSAAPVQQSEPFTSPSSTLPFRRDADFVDRRTSHDHGTLQEQIEQQCAAPAARVALVGIGGAG